MRAVAVRAAVGTALAAVLALVVYAVARATGEPFTVTPPGQPETEVNVAAIVVSTVVGGVLGLLLALLALRTPRPRAVLLVAAAVGTLLSFLNPASATDSAATVLWLCLMHVVVAVSVVGALSAVVPARRGEGTLPVGR